MKKLIIYFLVFFLLTEDNARAYVNHPSKAKETKSSKSKTEVKTIEKLLLITGCSRSGTSYSAMALTNCGLDLGHESSFGFHGIVSWFLAIDSDMQPYGINLPPCKFKHVFLQVRNPLKAIASIETEPMESWVYVQRFFPQILLSEPNIVKAAKYWYYWNLAAEKKAEWIFRIEDLDLNLDEMSARLGIPLDRSGLYSIPRNTNTRGQRNCYSWEDLKRAIDPQLYISIVNMANRYGYPVDTIETKPRNNFPITFHSRFQPSKL